MGFSVETIALLFLIFGILNFDLFGSSARQASAWECNHMDTALIRIQPFNLNIEKKASSIRILYRNEACEKCNFVDSFSVSLNNTTGRQFEIDSYYTYDFVAEAEFGDSDEKKLLCQLKQSSFAECGEYEFDLSHCKIDKTSASDTRTFWSRNPLVLGMLVIAAFVLSTSYIEAQSNKNKKKEQPGVTSSRLQSLDAFRGFSLFLMIFVNYGSGGYKFLQHAPWHGITLADFVFPWFLWIMGFSVPLSTNTLLGRADAKKSALFVKVAARSLKMFCIGLMLNSKNGVELANLRYFGVFQRIALCYFFVATLEIVLHRNIDRTRALTFLSDLVWSKFHFLVVFSLAAVWHWLVFNMAVPGCPVGYLGPGGLHDNSSYSDCTGGATGYIDKILFGESHLYKYNEPSIYLSIRPQIDRRLKLLILLDGQLQKSCTEPMNRSIRRAFSEP
jgi:heparan-alpha-glucosaminide N-acetyltransferase